MSVYTTELRFICEYLANENRSQPQTKIAEIIETARPKIFDFVYPIFNPEHKTELETKIIRHFYTREICCETVGLWKFYLEQKLNEIMPYYNQLYESAAKEYDPFNDVDYTKEGSIHDIGTKEETGNSTSSTNGNSSSSTEKENSGTQDFLGTNTGNQLFLGTNTGTQETVATNTGTVENEETATTERTANTKDRYSDTPQGGLTGIENNTYLTNARITDNNDTATTTTNGLRTDNLENNTTRTDDLQTTNTRTDNLQNTNTRTDNLKEELSSTTTSTDTNNSEFSNDTDTKNDRTYIERVHGKINSISYSELILKMRETFINIDMLIINELEELFMLVY